MNFALAGIPILLILALMVGFRWGAARAGAAGYLAALLLALGWFGAGPEMLAFAHLKALLLAFDVLFIVWMAYLHFRIADEAGAIQTIGEALRLLTRDPGMQALVLGFAFASFLQGIGGFGVPIAIVAPMMVGLGFPPLSAIVIPAIGHSWSVTFGSLGSSFQALMAATGVPGEALQAPSAALLGLVGVGAGVSVVHAAAGWDGLRRLWAPAAFLSLAMAAGQLGLAQAGLWNLAATGAGAFGLALSVGLAGRGRSRRNTDIPATAPARRAILLAFSAYAILVAVMMAVQLVPAVGDFLGQARLEVQFPAVRTALGFDVPAETGRVIRPFSHGGAVLLYAALLGYLVYRQAGRYTPGAPRRILRGTVEGVLSSSISIVAMVTMAVVMGQSGMTDALARGIADGVGRAFPLAAPWIGALGAFMTGSNTNSNVVFSALQLRTAEILALSAPWILAAQTAGGAVGSVIAPTKVVVGAATAGMEGREGEVIARLAIYVLPLIAALSIATWLIL